MRALALYLAVVIIHESGHLLSALALGVPIRSFGGGKWGLRLTFGFAHSSYIRELVVLLSGSVAGLLSVLWIPDAAYTKWALVLNTLNLLPIEGLDGGGVLTCLLHLWLSADRADRVCAVVSRLTRLLFWLGGLWIVLRMNGSVAWLLIGSGMMIGL